MGKFETLSGERETLRFMTVWPDHYAEMGISVGHTTSGGGNSRRSVMPGMVVCCLCRVTAYVRSCPVLIYRKILS